MIKTPSEQDLHAYVDGRLDGADRLLVEQFLARDPVRAAEVVGWQRDAQRLRAMFGGENSLPDNPALAPSNMRAELRRQKHQWRLQAVAAVLCVGLGLAGGWQLKRLQISSESKPMADAIAAYQVVASAGATDPGMLDADSSQLQSWLDRHFHDATRLPDLSAAGFEAVGGRLFATDDGPSAMVLYRDAQGHAISFYVRPPAGGRQFLPTGQRKDQGLLAQYWSGQGYNYAFVSRDSAFDAGVVSQARRRAI